MKRTVIDRQSKDENDLQVVEMRVFTDSRPVQARAAALHTQPAFGEFAGEAELNWCRTSEPYAKKIQYPQRNCGMGGLLTVLDLLIWFAGVFADRERTPIYLRCLLKAHPARGVISARKV